MRRKRSFYRGEWVPIEVTQADIPVRGRSQPVPFEIWKTRNGAIVADVELDFETVPMWLSPATRPNEERRAYSMRWDTSGDLAIAFDAINRATDWASFTAAVASFALPSSNMVYADVDGNIGYVMSGRVPVRASGDGRMAVDGSAGLTWNGSIDPATLPRVLNPDAGFIASSNNLIDRGFSPLITNDWAAPFRATRLRELLTKAEGVTLEAMGAMQNDKRSAAADLLLAGLPSAIKLGRSKENEREWADKLEELSKWDRVVDNRPIVSYYQAFEDAVWRRTFVDEMEEALFDKFYEWAGAEKFAGIYALLDDPRSKWWDDILTVELQESRDEVFLTAAQDAEIYLRNEWGGESRRGWDRVHGARFSHVMGNRFPLQFLFNKGPVPVDGDGTTVMRVSFNRLNRYAAWEYPSWRQLFDVGQWDDSRVILPSGQSGHPLSPFYFDQNEHVAPGPVPPAALFARSSCGRRPAPPAPCAITPAFRRGSPALDSRRTPGIIYEQLLICSKMKSATWSRSISLASGNCAPTSCRPTRCGDWPTRSARSAIRRASASSTSCRTASYACATWPPCSG